MNQFLSSLTKILDAEMSDNEKLSQLKETVLAFGSETEDNLNCIRHLDVVYEHDYSGIGIRNGPLLASIINSAEYSSVPECVYEAYPSLTQQEWQSTLRFCTLLLSSLEDLNAKDN